MITLAIVGIMMGLVVGTMSRSKDRNMKKSTALLASTIRYLYNKSAMEGLYIRLVIDLDKQSYWVEATADPFVISREEDTSTAALKAQKEKQAAKEKAAGKTEGEPQPPAEEKPKEGEPKKMKPPEPKFSPVDSYLLRPTKLPDRILFKDLQVEHKNSPVENGQESIYFFPNGYVEHAIINFHDDADEINYSLETKPMSGGVSIEDRYRSLSESMAK